MKTSITLKLNTEYLQKHADEIEAFCAYEPVRAFKIVNDARESFGASTVGEDFYSSLLSAFTAACDPSR